MTERKEIHDIGTIRRGALPEAARLNEGIGHGLAVGVDDKPGNRRVVDHRYGAPNRQLVADGDGVTPAEVGDLALDVIRPGGRDGGGEAALSVGVLPTAIDIDLAADGGAESGQPDDELRALDVDVEMDRCFFGGTRRIEDAHHQLVAAVLEGFGPDAEVGADRGLGGGKEFCDFDAVGPGARLVGGDP